jgi:hypothetical protein
MLDSELDARLRRAGERWRSSQPSWGQQPMVGTRDVAATRQPNRPSADRRQPLLAAIAAIAVIGSVALVVAKTGTQTAGKTAAAPFASASASHTGSSSPSPVRDTAIPPGTGPFFHPAGITTGLPLFGPSVAHGPRGYIVVELDDSSSCSSDVRIQSQPLGPQHIAIAILPRARLGWCTTGLTPRFSTLPLPAGVDGQQELWITIGPFTIDLPPSHPSGDDSITDP